MIAVRLTPISTSSSSCHARSRPDLREQKKQGRNCFGGGSVGGSKREARADRWQAAVTSRLSSPGELRREATLPRARGRQSRSASRAAREAVTMAAHFPPPGGVVADQRRTESGNAPRRVGAVFFDLDDTLVLTHQADSVALSAVLAIVEVRVPLVDRSAVLRDFLEKFSSQAWDPEHKVEVTEWRAGLWGNALRGQGVDDMDLARDLQKCFDRERLQSFRWTASVETLVRSLHSSGVKVGIITNGHPQVQRAKLKACNAEELFDTILVGGEEPNAKPHPDIFLKACQLAACKPGESVMVGDTVQTDIQGGKNAGFLATVWVNVHKKELPLGAATPDHEISSFSELQALLEQLGVVFDACV